MSKPALPNQEGRGFPRKKAGEDFYLLGKLIKRGPCQELTDIKVTLVCRESQRVPFGTGRGTLKVMDLQKQGQQLSVLPPEVFRVLAKVLKVARDHMVGRPIKEQRIMDLFLEDVVFLFMIVDFFGK